MPRAKKASQKRVLRAANANEVFSDLEGLAKENYLIGLDTAHSMLEGNKRFVDAQHDNFNKIQMEYVEQIKSLYGKLPQEYSGLGINEKLDRIIDMQNNYFSFTKKVSDNYTKELLDLNQRFAERTFSALDKYAEFFKS